MSTPLDLNPITERLARALRWLDESLPAPEHDETDEQTGDLAALDTLIRRHVPAMLERLKYTEDLIIDLATTAQITPE